MTEMTRLHRLRPGNVGNLGFLPIEICNNIYKFILADFKQCGMSAQYQLTHRGIKEHLENFTRARHSIDTTILRTSRDVYREAYDVMVKQNRFVRVVSRGVPRYMLNAASLPVVTARSVHAKNFRGYVAQVSMTFVDGRAPELQPHAEDHFEVIILAEDLDKLFLGLMEGDLFLPGFRNALSLGVVLGAGVTRDPGTLDFEDSESLERFLLTEKCQREIIRPFRDSVQELDDVQANGQVSADITDLNRNHVEWDTPQKVLDHFKAQQEKGAQYLEKKEEEGWLVSESWMKCICEMDLLRRHRLWSRLAQEGGDDFIQSFASMYLCFNLICVDLHMNAARIQVVSELIQNLLARAYAALRADFWKEGFTSRLTGEQWAQLRLTFARSVRMRGDLTQFDDAQAQLRQVITLFPDDQTYWVEYRDLMAWYLAQA